MMFRFVCFPLHYNFLPGLLFNPKDGREMFPETSASFNGLHRVIFQKTEHIPHLVFFWSNVRILFHMSSSFLLLRLVLSTLISLYCSLQPASRFVFFVFFFFVQWVFLKILPMKRYEISYHTLYSAFVIFNEKGCRNSNSRTNSVSPANLLFHWLLHAHLSSGVNTICLLVPGVLRGLSHIPSQELKGVRSCFVFGMCLFRILGETLGIMMEFTSWLSSR